MKWTRKRALTVGALSVGGLGSLFAGAAWAPPSDTTPMTFGGMTLSIDGVEVGRFTRCLGLGSKTEVKRYELVEKDGTKQVRFLPGNSEPGKIVCERGLSSDLTLAAWRDLVVQGGTGHVGKSGIFILHDSAGAPVARWNATNMWPSELTNYFSSSTGREVVTFASDSTTRVSP